MLTCVGPSRDLWNVNNAASVQLCAAFLILPAVWGENGGSFHHIYPARPSPLSSRAVTTRSFLGFFFTEKSLDGILLSNPSYSYNFYHMVSWDLLFLFGEGSGGVIYFHDLCWGCVKLSDIEKGVLLSSRFRKCFGIPGLPRLSLQMNVAVPPSPQPQPRIQLGKATGR